MTNHGTKATATAAPNTEQLPLHTNYFSPALNTIKRAADEPCPTKRDTLGLGMTWLKAGKNQGKTPNLIYMYLG